LLLGGVFVSFLYRGRQAEKPEWLLWAQIFMIFPFALYSLYFLSLGRKKYFTITEDLDNVFAK